MNQTPTPDITVLFPQVQIKKRFYILHETVRPCEAWIVHLSRW